MYRVELKVVKIGELKRKEWEFLMYRVELKVFLLFASLEAWAGS